MTAPVREPTHHRAALLLGTAGLVFDGYDLVVYGAVVPLFLAGELGPLDAAGAGRVGAAALVGVLLGALAAGAAADRWGRRPVLLVGYAWFSLGMAVTALTATVATFAAARAVTGIGIGIVVAVTGALVAETAPPGRRQLATTIAYCGIPLGSVLGTLAALALRDPCGWRPLFWPGALPLVTLLPLAWRFLPESPTWTGRAPAAEAGFRALFRPPTLVPALLLGVVSAIGLLLVFALGTWLPELMARSGFDAAASLVFLGVLNGGAIAGALLASPLADRFGPRTVVAASFTVGALALALVATQPPAPALLALVAVAGLGTTGTQILVIGLAAATVPTNARGAGVAWCTGFGRIGGIAGPVVVGSLVAAGLAAGSLFGVLAVLAATGAALTLLVRRPAPCPRPPRRGATPRRTAVASAAAAAGTTIEWYDFYLRATATALVFSTLFFPSVDGDRQPRDTAREPLDAAGVTVPR